MYVFYTTMTAAVVAGDILSVLRFELPPAVAALFARDLTCIEELILRAVDP